MGSMERNGEVVFISFREMSRDFIWILSRSERNTEEDN